MPADHTQRFSSRVANYVASRPSYPPAVVQTLAEACQLAPSAVVADVGSGTGIFSALLLEHGFTVYGVEPNREMREAGEVFLRDYPRFHSVSGTAESTTLDAGSVNLVTAGQAFHWFDIPPTRREWLRILRPGGWVALIWNERLADSSPFMVDYEALLKALAPDYAYVCHRDVGDEAIAAFFSPSPMTKRRFPNHQDFDWDGLLKRALSSSYVPEAGQPSHEVFLAELAELYRRHAQDGGVRFDYETTLYYGQLVDW